MTQPLGPTLPLQNVFLTSQIWNGIVPSGGLKALRAVSDWSLGNAFTVDLTLAQQNNRLSNVQTIYIDNSANDAAISVIVAGTLMNITIGAGWQGTFPVLSPNPPSFVLQSAGTGVTIIYFMNAPLPCLTWPSAGGTFTFDGSGALIVTDQLLDSTIVNNAVNVQELPQVSPYTEAVIDFAAAGDNQVIAAPAAGLRIRVYGLELGPVSIATNIIKRSGATALTGLQAFPANGGQMLDRTSFPWYTCGPAEAFIINQSAAAQIGGRIWYTVLA